MSDFIYSTLSGMGNLFSSDAFMPLIGCICIVIILKALFSLLK